MGWVMNALVTLNRREKRKNKKKKVKNRNTDL